MVFKIINVSIDDNIWTAETDSIGDLSDFLLEPRQWVNCEVRDGTSAVMNLSDHFILQKLPPKASQTTKVHLHGIDKTGAVTIRVLNGGAITVPKGDIGSDPKETKLFIDGAFFHAHLQIGVVAKDIRNAALAGILKPSEFLVWLFGSFVAGTSVLSHKQFPSAKIGDIKLANSGSVPDSLPFTYEGFRSDVTACGTPSDPAHLNEVAVCAILEGTVVTTGSNHELTLESLMMKGYADDLVGPRLPFDANAYALLDG